ncbi:hypothetical protein KZO01_20370 [Kurthia zopfii]|uniref:Protein of uncharacterized function DUF262 n=1 Tax=Kurthia zopfii TaxID=1650 RepID=A0A8B4QDD8_9BACL|nr:DUF262 domain-containing protein [Kurthia zopfii]PWI22435.1 hypothetical protein DF281_06930 [Kurthia zopfii]TDR38840.1 uncharacterized protein DUF262 [Kurthia zopfii]GEK31728.1 hypothetical protein KZO01_20370 [Kurthia zopfii]STX10746.1 Protein of uncharacterised function DUF262 [Kurthia zopfii]
MNIDQCTKEDLLRLEEIAIKQGNVINLSIILITVKPKDDELQDILNYFEEKNIKVINSDIEPDSIDEKESDSTEMYIKPFDPSKIDIKMDKMTIDSIIKRIKYGELEFDSDFQRKSGLWNIVQKSQLIESILLRIPLPAFYFDAYNDDKWLIIDGLQRVGTLKEFIVEKSYQLKGMEFLQDLNGLNFDKLPRSFQRRIEETNVNAYLVNPATPPNVKFNIFKRINTGGLVLEPQEIRNALYQGNATKLLKELADLPVFTSATDQSIKKDRMLDREFCLRYVAFTSLTLDIYSNIEEYLNAAMGYLNEIDEKELQRISNDFSRSMTSCNRIFGKYAFRKMADDGRRRPINKAVFEIWSHITYKLKDNEIEQLIKRKSEVQSGFIELCGNNQFLNLLKSSNQRSIKKRIDEVKNMVTELLVR